ncbi:MAG: hypothetical protein QOF30_1369 [Acidimicrobiaceae bacterium]|nr:hypothetical protein [Acidimicrobiaceae bacterium]
MVGSADAGERGRGPASQSPPRRDGRKEMTNRDTGDTGGKGAPADQEDRTGPHTRSASGAPDRLAADKLSESWDSMSCNCWLVDLLPLTR